jgi:hypothetical protein
MTEFQFTIGSLMFGVLALAHIIGEIRDHFRVKRWRSELEAANAERRKRGWSEQHPRLILR